ncbi:MAG TPA: NUDIX hydrolase, partial [Vicinamibacteria bacterium]|nr:NUDIX hydrolase [Vicinamibacteria bacterium]
RAHRPEDEAEARDVARILEFIGRQADPFDRRIAEGHLTGSAFVVDADGLRVLLLHHRKLDRWLQPGGHAEPGDTSGESVALREVLEETGLVSVHLHPRAPRPLDVDVHEIPSRPGEPAHAHLDLRYLVVAGDDPLQRAQDEAADLRWFRWDEIEPLGLDAGLRRGLAKARRYLA